MFLLTNGHSVKPSPNDLWLYMYIMHFSNFIRQALFAVVDQHRETKLVNVDSVKKKKTTEFSDLNGTSITHLFHPWVWYHYVRRVWWKYCKR